MNHQLVIISGPTACGKDAVVAELLNLFSVLTRVVTTTTRPKRREDRNGVDYYFETPGHFEQQIKENALLEWAVVHGNYYGLPKASLDTIFSAGRVPVLIIDVQGAKTIKQLYPNAFSIFLYPDPWDAYFERLTNDRGSERNFAQRIQSIRDELVASASYDAVVVNREGLLNDTIEAVVDIVAKYLVMQPKRVKKEIPTFQSTSIKSSDVVGR